VKERGGRKGNRPGNVYEYMCNPFYDRLDCTIQKIILKILTAYNID